MSDEQYGFVFSLTFIIVFGALLATIPVGFQGAGATPDMVIPIDPSLVTGFSDFEDWNGTDMSGGMPPLNTYVYVLGGFEWVFQEVDTLTFRLGAKVKIGGVLWLGQLDSSKFISPLGTDRGGELTTTEIDADDIDGTVKYSLLSIGGGYSQGSLLFYWNTTTYDNSSQAWDNDGLYMLHGIGFAESATSNIGVLLVNLLFLQLPDVPMLVNVLLVTPLWACIIFVLWFIIKEMIPFV